MNFFEKVTALIRAVESLEDLGKGLARALDHGHLLGFVLYGASDRCLVAVPYQSPEAAAALRDRFERSDWRAKPRVAFQEAFASLEIPTGEIGEGIRWAFLGPEDEPLGAFACVRDPAAAPPSEPERKMTDFFFNLAGELAQGTVRRRSHDRESEERTYLLDALNQIGRLMLGRPDRSTLLPSLLKIALDVARTEVGSILLEKDGAMVTEVEWGIPGELLEGIRFIPEENGILERMRETLEPVIVDDFSGPSVRLPDGFPVKISVLVSVPLLAGNRLAGILNVATGEDGREMLSSTVTALTTIASLITTAVENLRLGEALAAKAEAAHQGLAEEQNLLRSVLGSIGEGVLVSDSAGKIVLANPAAEEMLGLGGAAGRRFPGRNVVTLRPFFAWLRDRWTSGTPVDGVQYRLDVHPPAIFTVKIQPLRSGLTRFSHVTVVHAGTRDGVPADSRFWAERTAMDLEPPLSAVRAALALAQCAKGSDLPARMVGRGLDRLVALAEDLRDQELLDGGSLEVDRTEFIFNTAVAGVINSLKEEIAEKRIAFRPPDPQHLAVVRADRPRLTRALGRIFAEAVRWTAEEGWLRVDIVQGEEAAEISFGFLLSPAFQGFEDLFLDGGGKAKDKEVPACRGTIGLAVARRIVELHGGRISARSEKDMEGYITLAFPMREPLRMEDKLEVEPSHEHGSDFRIIPV